MTSGNDQLLKTLLMVGSFFAATLAQGATPVTPPARADIALQGKVLQSTPVVSQAECLSACQATPGCSGFSLALPGFAPSAPKSNCTVLTGTLNDANAPGFVSCRMPCLDSLQSSGARTIKPGLLTQARPVLQKPPISTQPVATYLPPVLVSATAAPPPAPRNGIRGHEVVAGPMVTVPPLSNSTTFAQCPAGKVALSAAYEFLADGDAAYGLEVHGAYPDGPNAMVLLRNANVFVAAQGRAIAVCAYPPAGMRVVSLHTIPSVAAACNANERLVGGGADGQNQLAQWTSGNGPWPANQGGITWQGIQTASSANGALSPPGATSGYMARALCAPENEVNGWEYLATPVTSLGARVQTVLSLTCPTGKVMLAGGFLQHGLNLLDIVSNRLLPTANSISARILNRNILGVDPVRTSLSTICASAQ